ncbi:MAG: hypothetical protein KF774_17875 [Planctomyces sp.]|nr:hypothetical protein [Planctomyces sp.]
MILDFLQQQPVLASAPAATVLAALNAATIEVVHPRAYTAGDLVAKLGAENAAIVLGTLDAAGQQNPILKAAWVGLSTLGISLHTPDRQAMIDGLAAAGEWPGELRDAVKALGVEHRTPWQQFAGEEPLPTVEEIAAAQVELNRQQEIEALGAHVLNEIITPAIGSSVSVDDVRTQLAAWLEGD